MNRYQKVRYVSGLAVAVSASLTGASAGTFEKSDPVKQAQQNARSAFCTAVTLEAETAISDADLTLAKAQSVHDLSVAAAEQVFAGKKANPGGRTDADTAQFQVDIMSAAALLDDAKAAHADALVAIRAGLVATVCDD
ncbi:hypothetical protein SAMN04488078_100287 [Antarctobacter heliothermus]|uniref:Uncharacterized protein n=2 Tax=Antarctobacter heliothermus TaxID=74033 RepID=A0A239B5P4_9RHOB|nr:hypothetical protein SAMN04488078_100287 [Antarctobacter heliothermus]